MANEKKTHDRFISTDLWYAWRPVKTNDGWVWFEVVERTIDDRPLVYLGLLTTTTYERIKTEVNNG